MFTAQPSVSRTSLIGSPNPTDKSVGYFHSSASPTFAAKPLERALPEKLALSA
jgi:hypothetical protein